MTYSDKARQYADDVLAGKFPAGLFVHQACQRFVDDLARDDWQYAFDEDEVGRWCRFLEKLPHVKGRWAAKHETLTLSDWQVFIVANLYGWRHIDTGLRRFREAYVEVGRKNGKSFMFGGVGLGMLCIDGEFGAEVYCGATSEKQAWEIFRPARLMCQRKEDLREFYGIEVNAKTLVRGDDLSRFEPVIGNPGDGSSPSCAIADEFHEHANSDQTDTMMTGMGSREQPLMIYVTTAGTDMGGPCYDKRADVLSILSGSVDDDRIFGIIYTIDEGDEWDTVAAQRKANPNLGISISEDFLEGQLKQARRSPSKQSAYKTKHLNMWVGAKAAWMNMLAYQACRKTTAKLESHKGRRCFAGIDLASKIDVASMALLFPPDETHPKWAAFVKHYLPEDTINDNLRYQGFHAGGWLTATPGNIIDYEYIEDDLNELKSDYELVEVPYDPFQATQFSTRMTAKGFPMVELGATVKNFSDPMKELEAVILNQQIEFDMCPMLLWMFGNVTAKMDKKDNIFPNKERNENKIDGVVALIMALSRALPHVEQGSLSDFLANQVNQ